MDEGRSNELTVGQWEDIGNSTAAEMNLKYDLDQALITDLEGVQKLELEAYGDHAYSYVVLRQFFDMCGELFRVCRDTKGNVIAYGIVARSVSQDCGWFHSLVVGVDHRRKSIGTQLARQLMSKADSHSIKETFLTVQPDNKTAISLYEKLGFTFVKIDFHYYGRNEKRIIMKRSCRGTDGRGNVVSC